MRIRVPTAKGDPEALEEIRRTLSSVGGVTNVSVNHSLGTVTISYDHAIHDELHRHLTSEDSQHDVIMSVMAEPKLADLGHMDEMIEKEAVFLADHSHAAKAVLELVHRFDRGVKQVTNNTVDLKVLAPLALAIVTFTELGVAAATPVWMTLGLFSFNHFIDLNAHRPHRDPTLPQQSETQPVAPRNGRKRPS
jgi:copper chaperone CopZ